jgi:hypothetical protein
MKKILFMGRAALCIALFLLPALPAFSQPGQEPLNNFSLRSIQQLLEKWKHPVYYDETGKVLQQQIWVSERQQSLYIGLRIHHPEDSTITDRPWYMVTRVPLLAVDTIFMNYSDSLLLFETRPSRVSHFHMGSYLAGRGGGAELRARLPEVRNLAGQIMGHLRDYQRQQGRRVPATARELVSRAVYDYIAQRSYLTEEVKKLDSIRELFVPKCQICEGSRQGFRDYVKFTSVTRDVSNHTFDLRTNLFNGTTDERMKALEQLVSEAVSEYYENSVFSDVILKQLKAMLNAERKKSMAIAGGKKCASCDGACTPAD